MNGHASINRLYRLVWSDAQGGWVAVAENARGRGKSSGRSQLVAALFAGLVLGAQAQNAPGPTQLPTGGQVKAGSIAITQAGNRLDVHQTTQRGAIDWATFNIGSQAQVNFAQPSATSVTLNTVHDTQASQIFGRLTSNGQVFLSNPNGVYFSPTASVDVGGLVATTGTVGTSEFMAGSSTFTRGEATGSVVNDGTLTAAPGGYIALLAPEVRNNGVVSAQAGTVALASGDAIQLQFDNSRSLTGVLVSPSTIAALVENGNAVRAPGGMIILSAQAADQLQGAVVRNSGSLEATGLNTQGGRIVLESSGLVDNGGSVDVSGQRGGRIVIAGDHMLNEGTLRADGTLQGGAISNSQAHGLVETTHAVVSATGGGGRIAVDAGAGQLYTSARYDADGLAPGQKGGSIGITADKVALMGAHASADGDSGGGSVLVGGDLHGAGSAIVDATITTIGAGVTLSADAITRGDGGRVIVWADATTMFAGSVSARGGAMSGNGGTLEVSGKGTLYFRGTGDASASHGSAGTLLLDPKNIVIDDQVSAQVEYVDPHSTATGTFGAEVDVLTSGSGTSVTPTGYVVITNPTDNLAAANGGAAYLFRQSDQALISTLYGTHSGDQVGYSGSPYNAAVTSLTNGNFVVGSPLWNGGRGAVTFGNGTTGWGGGASAVSSSNSLVGSLATHNNSQGNVTSDAVGSNGQVKVLPGGNYVVADAGWGNSAGAVAFGNGSGGSSGVIGSTNALVGTTVMSNPAGTYSTYGYGDNVGASVTVLPNGNYVVDMGSWSKGVGAVALGSGTTGLSGVVGAGNSLVGTTSRSDSTGNGSGTDKVGYFLRVLDNSEFIFWSASWNNGAGEVTWSNGSTLPTGVVSSGNSLVGAAGDGLSGGGITSIAANSAYVISSPSWGSGKGAATYVPFGTDVKSLNVATNGVVGATAGDSLGSQSVTLLADGDYVLSSPAWSSGKGAVTLVDGTTGKTKVGQGSAATAVNSIVGSASTDHVGQNGILELTGSGDFLALSPNWSNGATSKVGAVTWSTGGTNATVGAVSAGNSLVGTYANDRIGEVEYNVYYYGTNQYYDNQYASVTALTNGNYVVSSPMWNGTRGAVTLGNGSTGSVGAVTSTNSLVGSSAGDYVGSFSSPVAANSPTPAYFYLSNGVQALANGNFVVTSDFWGSGGAARAGAVTWSSGSGSPTVGAVSAGNSLVGGTANDLVGYSGGSRGVQLLLAGVDSHGNQLYSGNYVVQSGSWDNGAVVDAGAVTWGSGTSGVSGAISSTNSIVGAQASEMGQAQVMPLGVTGNYLVLDPLRDVGGVARAGALTFVDGSSGRLSDYAANGNRNIVGAANSLAGSTTDDLANASLIGLFTASNANGGTYAYTGNYVLASYYWDNGSLVDAGAVTWGSGSSGVMGTISRANSLVGEKAGDYLGSYLTTTPTGDYVVGNPTRDIAGVVDAGAASWVAGTTGRLADYAAQGNQNIVSAANSLVGSHPADHVGNGVSSFYDHGGDASLTGYFVFSTDWNCNAGAITYVANGGSPLVGVVGAGNSAVGDPNGNLIGGLQVNTPYPSQLTGNNALVTFGGAGGHVYQVSPVMPATGGTAIANATGYADAPASTQMITPDYVAGVLRTGTNLTLQASNDILVKQSIDATGGTAGGSLTLDAGRSIAVLGDIVTGNRNLTLVANDTVADGVANAQRDAGIATISMGGNPQGHIATIDAGTGAVSITMSAGADKTNAMGGSIGLNGITAAAIKIVDHGNGQGAVADLPTLSDCCGYTFGYQGPGADIVLNAGAVLHATGGGTAVTLAADGRFVNTSGGGTGTIVTSDPTARWLVYASAPTTSTFGGLDSGDTAVWNQAYDPNTPVAVAGDRYVFAYQPTVTVSTQNATKVYGTDLTGANVLASQVLTISGAQTGVVGAYLGDTLATAITGSPTVTSAGAAATAGVAAGPYTINVNLAGVTGNNGYAVALGSNTPRTLTVTPKALSASLVGVTKVYDGSTAAALTSASYQLAGLVNGDSFDVTQSVGTYNSASVLGAASASVVLSAGNFSGVNGALASNYTLPTSASGSAGITPKAITATLVNVGKTYDGTSGATLAAGNYQLGGFVGSQSATVTRTSGSFDSADVATAHSVSTTLASADFSAAGGTALSNYTLPTTAIGVASIAPKQLTTTLSGNLGKVYDGTTADTLSASEFTVTGFVAGQSATVTQAAGNFNSANVASASMVTATLAGADYAVGAGTTLSNYVLPTSASAAAAISRAPLTVTANDAIKVYDGTAWTGGNGLSYGGFVNNESATVLGGAPAWSGSSQGAVNVGHYAIVPGGLTAANYTLSYVAGTLAIDPRQLIAVTANLVGNLGKTYDGTNVATLGAANFDLLGFVNGDSATVTRTTGTYDGVNAGSHAVTATLASGDFVAAMGTNLANYTLPTVASGSGTIAPRAVTLVAPSVTKVYDGGTSYATTAANLASLSAALVGGDTVTTATLAYADRNAGAGNKTLTLGGVVIDDGNNGNNYVVTRAGNSSSTITPRTLTVGASASGRVYDASNAASVSFNDDRVGGDQLTVADVGAQFVDKNVGIGKTVNVSGLSLSGADASNYVLASTSATATADITPATLLVGGVAAVNRSYDTQLGVALSGIATVHALGNDVVTLGGTPTATMGDKNAGTGKAVTVSGYTINDPNYALVEPQGLTVDVAPAVLQVGGLATATATKVYDGTTNVMLGGTPTVIGFNGEVVTVSGAAIGQTPDRNVGSNKAVTISGLVSSDPNYAIGQQPGLAATVTPAPLVVSGVSAVDRSYDTTTRVTLSGTAMVLPIAGDVVVLSGTPVATIGDKNVGTGKAVTVGGYVINDANYVLVEPTGLTVNVAPALLALGGLTTAATKTYDATTGVVLGGTPAVTGLNGEVVNVVGTAVGVTSDKNVGANKAVTVSGLSLSDANYVLAQEPGLATTVTPASLAVTGVTAVDRAYDTHTGVALAGTATVAALGSDLVTLSGTGVGSMADKNAGQGKAVSIGGYAITDPNYVLVQPQGVTVDIAPAVLQLTGVTTASASKTYDGTRTVSLNGTPTVTGFDGEVVTVSGAMTGMLADKNVGTGKAVTVGGLVSSDPNYAVGQQPGLAIAVTPATLVVGGVTANGKQFDGSANATLSGAAQVAPVAGDDVALSGTPVARFANADVGVAKPVTVSGYTLNGADKGNYVVLQPLGLTADVTAAPAAPPPVVVPAPVLPTPPASPPLALPLAPVAMATPVNAATGILVSLVSEPSTQQQGVVAVSVPKEVAQAGTGFTFPMPAQVTQAYSGGAVTTSLQGGAPLPAWIQYDTVANVFVVTSAPAGGLPVQVVVTVDGQSVVVTISER